MNEIYIMAIIASLGTWFVTALGAGTVVFFKSPDRKIMNLMLGFASGVMIAASFWSLLAPAIEKAEINSSIPAYIVATAGFMTGVLFMWCSDKAVVYARRNIAPEIMTDKDTVGRVIMLVLSVTMHNIPEGLAVGVAFGALTDVAYSSEALMGAITLAVGIALQNFPEGAAVSIPLRREGYSWRKAFFIGQASGMVEPLAAIPGVLAVTHMEVILPYALSFAAGTMITVAVHELIPECQQNRDEHSYFSTMGIVSGFAFMMLLDVMLG